MSEHSFMSCSVMSDSDDEQRILEHRQQQRYKKLDHAKAWPDYDLKDFNWEETDRVFREECIRQKERKRSKEHWLRLLRLIDQDEPCPFLVTELDPEDVVLKSPAGTWRNGPPFCFKSRANLEVHAGYRCRCARKETEKAKAKLLTAECNVSRAARDAEKRGSRMKTRAERHEALLEQRNAARKRFEEVQWEYVRSQGRCQEVLDHHQEVARNEENELRDRLEFLVERNKELEGEICRNQDRIAELEERHARGPTILKEQVKALRNACSNAKRETNTKKKTIKDLMGRVKGAGIDMGSVAKRIASKKEALIEAKKPKEKMIESQHDVAQRKPLVWEAQWAAACAKSQIEEKCSKKQKGESETDIKSGVSVERAGHRSHENCGSEKSCGGSLGGADKPSDGDSMEGPLPYYIGSKFGQELGVGTARGKNIRVDYGLYYFHGDNVPPFMQNKNKDKVWYKYTNSDGEEEIEMELMKPNKQLPTKKSKSNKCMEAKTSSPQSPTQQSSPGTKHGCTNIAGRNSEKKDELMSTVAGALPENAGPGASSGGNCQKSKPSPSSGCGNSKLGLKSCSPRSDGSSSNSSRKSNPASSARGSDRSSTKSAPKLSARRQKDDKEAPIWKPTSVIPTPQTSVNQSISKGRIKARPAPKHKNPFIPKKSAKPVTVPKEKLMWCEWRSRSREAAFNEFRREREDCEQFKYEEELRKEHEAHMQEKKERRAHQFRARPVPDFSKPFVPKLRQS